MMPNGANWLTTGIDLLGPFGVTLLLFRISSTVSRRYVAHWTRSFAALFLFHLATAGIILFGARADAPRLTQVALSLVAGAAAYLQLGWFAWGCFELATSKPLKIRDAQRLLIAIASAGLLSGTFPFLVARSTLLHHPFHIALHALASAIAVVACGVGAVRVRGRSFVLPAVAFLVYGAIEAGEFAVVTRTLLSRGDAPPMLLIAILDLVGSAVIALGIVIAVLEDERTAAAASAEQVVHLAYHDTVTGLPNRSLFSDRLLVALNHAQRHRYKLAVLFLDIDRFKEINDSLGHSVGDRMLRVVASRIRSAVREEDTVARFGGDEFTVIIHIIGRIEDAGKIAQKILDALKVPIVIDEREFVITSSIGISVYPVDGADSETLVRNADTAMYRAKENGRNAYQFYAASMNQKALETLDLENGLRRALAKNELVLFYQPLVDVTSGSVYGLEALIRWQHPQFGLLLPDRFLPAAEHSGLIIPIGRWVLREACLQAKEWHRRGREVVVAVNLSAKHFQEPDLLRQVRDALENADLRPQFLELEITEGNAMQDVEKAIATLKQLKTLGVRIAIDDFGTGYSCLSYLKQFPIDTLKLDASFVRDIAEPEDAQIALGVIALAHSLRLKVIAEGVETIGQLTFLREHRCDRLQGFLFSRPMPADQFERFMNQKGALKIA
jgi:diguanylate cyclase (GGDEF)-like protein